MATPELLDELAGAILDGTPIDWAAIESGAGDADRALLAPLRTLATLGSLHRDTSVAPPPPVPPAGASAPARFGPLRVLDRIGGGSSGDVYRAWDTVLEREVALKLLQPDPISTPADSILEEGRLLARVRHPNVVTIHGAEPMGDRVGLWMELVRGRTLEEALVDRTTFSPAETIAIGIQLCAAVSAVHAAGLLHRDVKTQNVMLADDGRVVLMDFGAGRRLDETASTGPAGTPLYLAPEVLQGGEATVASDVYGIGVVLYRLITHSYPVQAQSVAGLKRAHTDRMHGDRAPGSAFLPHVPSPLAAVVARALDPRPARRHQSAAALAGALEAVQRGPRVRVRFAVLAAAIVVTAMAAGLALTAPGSARPPASADATAIAPRESVRLAVLPFDAAGDDPDMDALRDGLAQGLIAGLEAYDNSRVISIESAMTASALNLPLGEIGSRMGVSSVLTGRVERSDGTVIVEATLLQLPDERRLWTRRYSEPTGAVLDIHVAVAADIAATLGLQRQTPISGWPTRDVQAHRRYVQALAALDQLTSQGTRLAAQLFEQALAIDPDYAQAHAGLALVHLQMNSALPNVAGEEALRRATAATARAMALDEWLPEAHVAAALIRSAHRDWTSAEHHYQRAIDLGPSNVLARQQYAHWLSLHGRHEDATIQARIAESLDPLSPRAAITVASALRFAGRYEEAIAHAHRALDLDPTFLIAYLNLGHNYQGLGRLDEAIDAFERMVGPSGNLGHVYALSGRVAEAQALIARFEQRYAETGLGAGDIAQVYSGLGDIDRALEWLERRDFARVGWPNTIKVAPVWDPLRGDPRFAALLRAHGLAD